MCKISVIVPVYNVENYLKESLNSLLKQTFKDFEIICINDGSTDNSQEILEQFSKIDKRVKLINKTNEGCGSARNKGLSLANGEYVYFFDPDDYIREDTLERLYTTAKNNDSDMVISQIAWVREGEPVNYNIPGFDFENIFTDVDYEDFTFNYEDIKEYVLNSYYAPWTKLYKRDFISKNNFKFHEKLAYDDVPFHVETIIKAEKISFIPEAFYHYRISNPTSVNKIPSNTVDIFRICDIVENILKENNLFEIFKSEFKKFKITQILHYILPSNSEFYYKIAKNEFLKIDIKNENLSETLIEKYNLVLSSRDYDDYRKKCNSKSLKEVFNEMECDVSEFDNLSLNEYVNTLIKENKNLKEDNFRLNEEVSKLKLQNEKLLSSNSWKLTKPLRSISKGFKTNNK